jgi:hypothetical protein
MRASPPRCRNIRCRRSCGEVTTDNLFSRVSVAKACHPDTRRRQAQEGPEPAMTYATACRLLAVAHFKTFEVTLPLPARTQFLAGDRQPSKTPKNNGRTSSGARSVSDGRSPNARKRQQECPSLKRCLKLYLVPV